MFICDKCGCCCRNIGKSKYFVNLDRGDGVCKYLVGNLCSIYNSRPLLCRVDESYDKLLHNKISKEEYYDINYKSCKILKAKR